MTLSSLPLDERVLLIGMMGAGKTTVGRVLAERLNWRHLDSDEEIVKATGRTVREIFEADGEQAFRREEAHALKSAISTPGSTVISVAGGAVLDEANRRLISAAGTVVWLRAPINVLAARAASGDHRPLLDERREASFETLYVGRAPLYEELADIVIDVEARTPDDIVAELAERLA